MYTGGFTEIAVENKGSSIVSFLNHLCIHLTCNIRPRHNCSKPRKRVIWHRHTIRKKLSMMATAKKPSGKLLKKLKLSLWCSGYTKYMTIHMMYEMKTSPIMLISIQFHPLPKYCRFPIFLI